MDIRKHSKWLAKRGALYLTFEVIGIWAMGGGVNYKPVSYELKDPEKTEPVIVPVEEMIDLIQRKIFIERL